MNLTQRIIVVSVGVEGRCVCMCENVMMILIHKYTITTTAGIYLTGRNCLNLWRRMKGELNLANYSVCGVTEHVLNRRVPHFTCEQLTRWNSHPRTMGRVVKYIMNRATLNLELMLRLDMIRR